MSSAEQPEDGMYMTGKVYGSAEDFIRHMASECGDDTDEAVAKAVEGSRHMMGEYLLYREKNIPEVLRNTAEAVRVGVPDMEAARSGRHMIDRNDMDALNLLHLASYIASLGGRLCVVAEFPDGTSFGTPVTGISSDVDELF